MAGRSPVPLRLVGALGEIGADQRARGACERLPAMPPQPEHHR
ncbi:hypothetical protein DSM104329_01351 [Capillimicrobium parvum]|uniref:Uncharacterized protein n=1 Tax=Capillimicrobium parvum TaxID=2884022 RepID=A0A9E6XUY8_9ACTN|nr:hypothetical protein DSM104329_01351 [Capillimicrobium parvum]